MKTFKIKDLMVPLTEYATVGVDATLYEAVLALEEAQAQFDHNRYRHRAVLILDQGGDVVGKVSQLDALRALEPKYDELSYQGHIARFGFTRKFIDGMLEHHRLWAAPMSDICRKAADRKVTEFMHTLDEGEFVDESATLDEAIHQLVIGHHQSLLVRGQGAIVGILRLTDVFAAVFHVMKSCGIDAR